MNLSFQSGDLDGNGELHHIENMYMIESYTYMNDPNEVRIESIDRHQHYYYYHPVESIIQIR